jgi:hypothetical protein
MNEGDRIPKELFGKQILFRTSPGSKSLDLFGNRIPKELFGKQILSKTSKDQ